MPFLIDPAHLRKAARACMRRASAPGGDGMSFGAYRVGFRDRIDALAASLADGTWAPGVPRDVVITTYAGKRIAAIVPTVQDRIVHRAMRHALEPVLEAALPAWVSGYRRGRNRLTAVRDAAQHLQSGRVWIADLDVADSSAGGTSDQVVDWLADLVSDGSFLSRVRTAVSAMPTPLIPGSGLWPVLFQLRMLQADRGLLDVPVVRFADNYTAFAADEAGARAVFARVNAALAGADLRANTRKSRIRQPGSANPEDLYLIDG